MIPKFDEASFQLYIRALNEGYYGMANLLSCLAVKLYRAK